MIMLSAIILSGGKSVRYFKNTGIRKQFANFRGKPLIYHTINSLLSVCDDIIISVQTVDDIHEVNSIVNTYFNNDSRIRIIKDKLIHEQNLGPLEGIMTCIEYVKNDICIVSPVDTPFVNKYIIDNKLYDNIDGLRTFIDNKGYITALNFIYSRDKLDSKTLYSLICKKLDLKLNPRITDIFLLFKNVELLSFNSSLVNPFVNINNSELMEEINNIKDDLFVEYKIDKIIKIKNRINYCEELDNMNLDAFKDWKNTMIFDKLRRDFERE